MPTVTQMYKSTDLNGPTNTGQVNSLPALLLACLVNGYTPASVTSIVESGTTYTVTLGSANATLVSGNYLKIAGGSPAGINGVWGPITFVDSTHVTFVGPGSLGTITGTITYAKAPLGWTSPYSGTNAAVFKQPAGSGLYLQVIDNAATAGLGKEAQAMGFETMSAFNTGTGQFPTVAQAANGLCWRKSTTADGTARAWTLVGDNKTFYLFLNDAGTQATTNAMGFGDFYSYHASDAYNCFIAGATTFNAASQACGLMLGGTYAATTGTAGFYIARQYGQTGSAINGWLVAPQNTAVPHGSTGGIAYANGADVGLYCDVLMVLEPTNTQSIRGQMRGLVAPLHNAPLANYETSTNVQGFSGVTFTCVLSQSGGTAGQVHADTFGPW